jgi:hypothetical protein
MTYVAAGTAGALTPDVIESLVADHDAVQASLKDGNALVFTLDERLPFFELVTAHTPVLAAACDVTLDQEDDASRRRRCLAAPTTRFAEGGVGVRPSSPGFAAGVAG